MCKPFKLCKNSILKCCYSENSCAKLIKIMYFLL